MRITLVALLLGLSLGCGGKPPARAAESGPTTRFREGDWVKVRYSGLFTKQPVVVHEEVKAQVGIRVRIEVSARRGVDERRWIQVITDTPENRKNEAVEELFLVDHGVAQKLPNPKNQDLRALHDWFEVAKEITDARSEKREVKISEVSFDCDVRAGDGKVLGRKVSFEEIDCPEFLWTHAGSRYWDPATGEELYKSEVVGFGRNQ